METFAEEPRDADSWLEGTASSRSAGGIAFGQANREARENENDDSYLDSSHS